MFKPKQFVPLYRIKVDKPNTNGMFKKSLDHFCFRTKGKKKRKKRGTAGVVPHNNNPKKEKGKKGSDSAFKDKHTMHLMETGAGLVT